MGVFWLPSYHDMGLIGGILQPLYVGRPNVLMSPMTFLQKPFRWLSAITRYRAPRPAAGRTSPTNIASRRSRPNSARQLDLSTWKVAFNGAEPVRAETLRRFAETFAPCGFRPGGVLSMLRTGRGDAASFPAVTCAKPPVIRSFDAVALAQGKVREVVPAARRMPRPGRLRRDAARPEDRHCRSGDQDRCPPGEIGEIWVSGPSMAQGYWQRPDATEATFQAYLKDTGEGPFLRTGDLGFMHDGELLRHRPAEGPDHPPRRELSIRRTSS